MRRDSNADLLKATAIFGVVFIHTPGYSAGLSDSFRFCVPAFVALWAMYFETGLAKRPKGSRLAYNRLRLVRLAVPYAFWTSAYLLLFHPTRGDWASTPLHTIVGGWLCGYGWPGQYFLIILFQLTTLVPLARRGIGKGSVAAIMLAGIPLYVAAEWWLWRSPTVSGLGDRLFVYWLPYVALGIGFARGYVPRLPLSILVIVAVTALALVTVEYRWAYEGVPRASPYILVSVYIGSVALMAALRPCGDGHGAGVQVAEPRSLRRTPSALVYVGRNTFPIFLANPLIIHFIPKSAINSLSQGLLGAIQHGVLTVGVICTCLLLGECLRRSRLGILVGI